MVKVLHLVSSSDTSLAFPTAIRQRAEHTVSFLLLQEGVRATPPAGFQVYAARDDCDARKARPPGAKMVTWPEIVNLLANHDRVLKW